jgi:hypothetical protein
VVGVTVRQPKPPDEPLLPVLLELLELLELEEELELELESDELALDELESELELDDVLSVPVEPVPLVPLVPVLELPLPLVALALLVESVPDPVLLDALEAVDVDVEVLVELLVEVLLVVGDAHSQVR